MTNNDHVYDMIIIGGGPAGYTVALYAARAGFDNLRATKIYHKPLMQAQNVEFRWNSTVKELLREEKIIGVRLSDVNTGEESTIACDGVFVSVGRRPATEFLGGQINLDGNGYVVAGEDTKTNIPGVHAVGDMRTKELRQIVTAVADGAVAVHEAEKYLAGGA